MITLLLSLLVFSPMVQAQVSGDGNWAPNPVLTPPINLTEVPTFLWPKRKKRATFMLPEGYSLEQVQILMPKDAPVGSWKIDFSEKDPTKRTIVAEIKSKKDLSRLNFFPRLRAKFKSPSPINGGQHELSDDILVNEGTSFLLPQDWIDVYHATEVDLYRIPIDEKRITIAPIASGTLNMRSHLEGRTIEEMKNLQIGGGAGVRMKVRNAKVLIFHSTDLSFTTGMLHQLAPVHGPLSNQYFQFRARLKF